MSTVVLKTYAGAEHYEVYLNDKLILQQAVTNAGIQLKNIPLESANPNDKITIIYRRCHNEVSTGRKITIKDENGNVLKTWAFADQTDTKNSMTILVKDLIALNKKGALNVEYSSAELMQGRTLVALSFPDKKRPNF
jgi:hypothetical protein